ncbi:MAG: response regulator [Candidatus Brocadiae bacterium]|nr:response regulator [Candidatus Brocadiia bacterium]
MKKILVVDDDLDIVDAIKTVLESHGFSVASYNNTQDIVQKIKKETPDLLLLDVMFPENSSAGFEVARAIRKESSLAKLPIIIFSAVNEKFKLGFMKFSEDQIDPDYMPVNDFLEKPIDCDILLEKIAKVLKN